MALPSLATATAYLSFSFRISSRLQMHLKLFDTRGTNASCNLFQMWPVTVAMDASESSRRVLFIGISFRESSRVQL